VLFMLQSGYFADRIMPIMLDSINGLNNESNRIRRLADPKFTRLVELMRDGQLAGAIQIRIERPKEGAESSVLIFGPNKDPQLAARGREIKNLLGIKQDLWVLRVNYGGYSGRDDEIDMMTRSSAADHAGIRGHGAGARGGRRTRQGGAWARRQPVRNAAGLVVSGSCQRYAAATCIRCGTI